MKSKIKAPTQIQNEPLAEVFDYTAGIITEMNPVMLPDNALLQADNTEFYRGLLFRRNGLSPWPVTKPNSEKVLTIFPFFERVTGLNILRFTRSTIYKSSNTWIQFTPSGIAANSGFDNDYFYVTVVDNRCFFANGIDPIREVDANAQTYKALGNAPKYKYITSAFNRVIGANLAGVSPIGSQVGWCGESNYGVWDPATDLSAGSDNLTTSATSTSDDITGIFSTSEMLIVARQQSIWLGIHTPSGSNPFSFFSAPGLTHLGADLPRTIKLTDFGLVWCDNQTSSVYAWTPSYDTSTATDPEKIEISRQIHRQLRSDLNNATQVWASYSHEAKTYSLFISYAITSTIKCYEYNFIVKAWTTKSIGNNLSCVDDVDYDSAALTINALTGTINALNGTIDSLGGLTQNTTRTYGFTNGDLLVQQLYSGMPSELMVIQTSDNGASFQTSVQCKIYEAVPYDLETYFVRFYLYPYTAGTVTLWMSKDDGSTWIQLKQVIFNAATSQKYIQLKRYRKARRITYMLTTNDCMCSFVGHIIRADEGGVSNK